MTGSRVTVVMLMAVLLAAAPLTAQREGAGGQRPGANRTRLLQNIEQVFLNQVTAEMALTADQQPRFRRVVTSWAQKRATLEAEERQLRQALRRELTPGVAANPDSVSRYVDALNDNRVAYTETFRDEMHELTPILNPVQRGQFQIRRDQLLQRIKDLQQQRPGGALRTLPNQEP
jgi:hypothetical protein